MSKAPVIWKVRMHNGVRLRWYRGRTQTIAAALEAAKAAILGSPLFGGGHAKLKIKTRGRNY